MRLKVKISKFEDEYVRASEILKSILCSYTAIMQFDKDGKIFRCFLTLVKTANAPQTAG